MKQKNLFWALTMLMLCFFVSCNNEEEVVSEKGLSPVNEGIGYPYSYKIGLPKKGTRAAAAKGYTWNQDELQIKFISGNAGGAAAEQKIIELAREWEKHIGITFTFTNSIPDAQANILIQVSNPATSSDKVNWSGIGTYSKDYIDAGFPSMNIVLDDINSNAFRSAVLMQFGHALGLIYEFQRNSMTGQLGNIKVDASRISSIIYSNSDAFGAEEYLSPYYKGTDIIQNPNQIGGDNIALNWTFDPQSIMLPWFKESGIITNKTTGQDIITTYHPRTIHFGICL